MPVTLTPILKTFHNMESNTPKNLKVHFEIPEENIENIIEYLQQISLDEDYAFKYKNFIDALLSPNTKESVLNDWLKQLKDNIFFLDKENERLTGALLRLDWTHKESHFVSTYQELMLNLVSAHTYYLRPVLKMLINIFFAGENETDSVTEKEKIYFQKPHKLLKDIISLVPLSPSILIQMIAENFPYLKRDCHMHVCYFFNLLEICTYLQSHRQIILELIADKLLLFDVHCPKDKIEEEEELEKEQVPNTVFPMDCEGENKDSESKKDTNSMAYPLANTLDLLMDSFFQFAETVCKKNGNELKWEATKKFYKEMLTVFDKLILSTHASAHVQFIMFYLCSLRPALSEGFLDYLWKKIQNPNTAPIIRQAATFYIGSFLARASYVSISTVTACFELMCNWIHRYIDNQTDGNHYWADTLAHGTFYSVCQAVFYVFAFRHKELIEMKNGLKYLRSLNFERMVTCRLNPLKICQPAIVQNFASVTKNYQLAYCYSIIERNNRNLMSTVIQTSSGTTETLTVAVLDTFFPFDPYILKRSKKWVDYIYRVYEGSAEEDHMEEEDDDYAFKDLGSSPVNQSLIPYCTSPGFNQLLSSPKFR